MSSAWDLFEDGFPHGTREGYAKGCHGGACPEGVEGRRTCREANMAYAGDQVYRHRVNAGMTPVQIAAEEAEDRAVEKMAGTGQRPAGKPVKSPAPSRPVVTPAPVSVLQVEAESVSPPPFGYSEAEVARMVELHQQGKNDSAIAREIGRSQPQVSKRLRRMGLPPNGKQFGGVPAEPPAAVEERAQEVRAEGILSELGEARAQAERLAGELDAATADLAIAQAANGTLTGQLAAAVRRAEKADEDLMQLNLTRDVELSAHAASRTELVAPSAPGVTVEELPVVRAGSVGLDIQQLGDALSVRLHCGEPVHLNLQFVDGALADVGVKIGA